ncbi:glycosyltransferase [Flavobacterium sp. LB1P62]|uniref:glycosyltransferase n=1 Tax=Flavobacterium sp. LB1P62 TaxID=3401715 RepID=UPI003AAE9E88
MRIVINCSNLRVGGGLQVAHSFLNEISQNKDHEFLVILSDTISIQIERKYFCENFRFITFSIKPSIYKAFSGKDAYLSSLEIEFNADVVFSVFGSTYWKPKAKHICGFAKPDYIYKESPYFNQINFFQKLKLAFIEFIHMFDFKNNNSLLITENKDVANRLINRVSQKVVTVTNTFNQIFKDEKNWDKTLIIDSNNIDFKFLTISANYPHKNLKIIKSVIPILKKTYPDFRFKFYLSITADDFEIEANDVLNENIQFLGKVNINQCPSLYEQCDFLFLPTLLECFSASYCEAMYMRLPILTSDLSFAKGICGNAASYFNPIDPADIANSIYNLATNKEIQNHIIKNGDNQLLTFDTSQTRAKKYLELITSH